jgi:hypothetical protein
MQQQDRRACAHIGRCDVHEGKLVDLGAGIRHLADVAEGLEPPQQHNFLHSPRLWRLAPGANCSRFTD